MKDYTSIAGMLLAAGGAQLAVAQELPKYEVIASEEHNQDIGDRPSVHVAIAYKIDRVLNEVKICEVQAAHVTGPGQTKAILKSNCRLEGLAPVSGRYVSVLPDYVADKVGRHRRTVWLIDGVTGAVSACHQNIRAVTGEYCVNLSN